MNEDATAPNPDSPTVGIPPVGTESTRDFVLTHAAINRFSDFVLHLAGRASQVADIAHRALSDVARTPEEKAQYESSEAHLIPLAELRTHGQFMIEALTARHVDNYLNVLSSLLEEIFIARPETMRSKEKIDLEFVLTHGSMDSLVSGIAERKVDQLSYASFRDLAEFFLDRFSLHVCDSADFDAIAETIELRNIIVHNRCRVNRRFVEKTGTTAYRLGERMELDIEDLDAISAQLLRSVVSLDAEARTAFRLPEHPIDVREAYLSDRADALDVLRRREAEGSR